MHIASLDTLRARPLRAGLWLAVLALWLLGRPVAAVDFIAPAELRPGMKGYGLSVFSGTTPARFEVELIAVMERALPGQDLLLVRCSGQDLEKTGVIAGMSGSPIYFEGRLAGALAYAWMFAKEPLAGVTPIGAMLEEMRRPSPRIEPTGPLRKLASPLLVSGLGSSAMAKLSSRLTPLGLVPVQGAGGRSDLPAPEPVPGGVLGVPLLRGDWNAEAIGTITHVDGDRILAFGHPFFGLGRTALPATGGVIHTVMSNLELSFKFGSVTGPLGALVEDRQSCVVVGRGKTPEMIPATIRTHNASTGVRKDFRIEVMSNALLTPWLVLLTLSNALDAVESSGEDLTADVSMRAQLSDGRVLALRDRFDNGRSGPYNLEALAPYLQLDENPFAAAPLASLDFECVLLPGRRTARILAAYPSAGAVRPGEALELAVVLKPYGAGPETVPVVLPLPRGLPAGELEFSILGGADVPPDLPEPEDLDGLLRRANARRRSTSLFVSYEVAGSTLRTRGMRLTRLPGSYARVLGGETEPAVTRLETETGWILDGQARASVQIRPQEVVK